MGVQPYAFVPMLVFMCGGRGSHWGRTYKACDTGSLTLPRTGVGSGGTPDRHVPFNPGIVELPRFC